ncbi:hypothetical protein MKX01_008919, partial [Papaver californicum]
YHKGPGSLCELPEDFKMQQKLKDMLDGVGLEAPIIVHVIHFRDAFGLVLKAVESHNTDGKTILGWELVYSDDTRPCQKLKDASEGVTVLIHEVTCHIYDKSLLLLNSAFLLA